MILKKQEYNISASYLIPAYNLPAGVYSHYLATQCGYHEKGTTSIDVWLVKAEKDNEFISMQQSLSYELKTAENMLEKIGAEKETDNQADVANKNAKINHAIKIFKNLLDMSSDTVYHKKPDAEFLKIARNNLMFSNLRNYLPNMDKAIYLAGLSYYNEH